MKQVQTQKKTNYNLLIMIFGITATISTGLLCFLPSSSTGLWVFITLGIVETISIIGMIITINKSRR